MVSVCLLSVMGYEQALQALADPTRREILEQLKRGPRTVGGLADQVPVTRPAVSQHLKVLEGAGLVRVRREGTRRIYSVEIRGLQELRSYLEGFWDLVLESFRAEADAGATANRSAKAPQHPTGRATGRKTAKARKPRPHGKS